MKGSEDKENFPQRLFMRAPILNDPRISMKALGIWVYMRMKPVGWDFAAERIARECTDGERAIRKGFDELEELGYLKRRRMKSGRCTYQLFEEQYGAGAPYEGDYDFEISKEFTPWNDEMPYRNSRHPDAGCTAEKLSEHLVFAYGLDMATAQYEAGEWEVSCLGAALPLTWRNADVWTEHMKLKYPKTQTAKTATISI